MILVTGATGNVGREVVVQLLEAGADVRALARDPGSARLPAGADVVRGDLGAPDTLAAAARGVASVLPVWPFPTAEAAPRVLRELGRGARRLVYLSSMSVRDDLERQADPISGSTPSSSGRSFARGSTGPSCDPAGWRQTRSGGRPRSAPRASCAGPSGRRRGR